MLTALHEIVHIYYQMKENIGRSYLPSKLTDVDSLECDLATIYFKSIL